MRKTDLRVASGESGRPGERQASQCSGRVSVPPTDDPAPEDVAVEVVDVSVHRLDGPVAVARIDRVDKLGVCLLHLVGRDAEHDLPVEDDGKAREDALHEICKGAVPGCPANPIVEAEVEVHELLLLSGPRGAADLENERSEPRDVAFCRLFDGTADREFLDEAADGDDLFDLFCRDLGYGRSGVWPGRDETFALEGLHGLPYRDSAHA
jgi:hypothetical protein